MRWLSVHSAEPTLAQHFRCKRVFLAFAHAMDASVGDLQLVQVVDLMHACDTSNTEDRTSVRISPKPMLKATFVAGPHRPDHSATCQSAG